ncbi:MAG: ROK family protein [Clostridia bacterium]|nr:ROK family protein [Clostridia bacterium]
MAYKIGFDIGGTKCAVVCGEETAEGMTIKEKVSFATDHTLSPTAILDKMIQAARDMQVEISSVGISCGGPLDSRRGVILSPPNLPGWDNVEATAYISEKLGVPAYLQNDANACALAEWKYGAGVGTKNMIFLTFGTGMGAGLILDGRLYSGASDMAGEIGHVRMEPFGPVGYGKAGSFEGFCSGAGIAQLGKTLARERFQMGKSVAFCKSPEELESVTAKKIGEYADLGDEDALAVYRLCAEKLGYGLSILIDILNPDCIVLGSIYQRQPYLFTEEMTRVIEREALPHAASACRILPAALGNSIGDYAALAVAEK